MAALPELNISSWDNDRLLAAFAGDGEGRRVTEDLIGFWLGRFDLIVIDEAKAAVPSTMTMWGAPAHRCSPG